MIDEFVYLFKNLSCFVIKEKESRRDKSSDRREQKGTIQCAEWIPRTSEEAEKRVDCRIVRIYLIFDRLC